MLVHTFPPTFSSVTFGLPFLMHFNICIFAQVFVCLQNAEGRFPPKTASGGAYPAKVTELVHACQLFAQ